MSDVYRLGTRGTVVVVVVGVVHHISRAATRAVPSKHVNRLMDKVNSVVGFVLVVVAVIVQSSSSISVAEQ